METHRTALWRNLLTPGHDAALVTQALTGWNLTGMAAFRGEKGPVAVNYSIEMDDAWAVRRGSVRGMAGGRRFYHLIERTPDGWTLDRVNNGMVELADLDFGFTPSTNLQQLTRVCLSIGERAEFPVVWFDIGREELVLLPQIYERRNETRYWYQSPADGYEATLVIDETGFVRLYPGLWEMEEKAASSG